MITLIKLIHSLDTTTAGRSNWMLIAAIVALGAGAQGEVRPATASTTYPSGIHHSLLLAQNQPAPTTTPPAPTATPPAPSPNNTKLLNDLNLPKTGGQVQITGKRALTLSQALDIADRNNRQIQVARLAIDRDTEAIRQAQAAQALQVGLNGSLGNSGSPVLFSGQSRLPSTNSSTISGGLQASYNILSAGANDSSVRAAEEQVRFNKLDLVRVQQQVRTQVLTAYFDLQAADSSVIIQRAAVVDATRSLNDAQLQEKAGVGTRFDILRAQVQLATANQNLANAQGQQQTARRNLAQLLAVDVNTEFTAADPVREIGTWKRSLADSIVLAFNNRPEIQQPLVQRSIAKQQEIVAAAGDAAKVDLVAKYSVNKVLNSSLSAQDDYSLGAQVQWNFWDGGAAQARASQQRVSQEITENQFTNTRNQVRFEVEQAYSNLNSNFQNIATSTQALSQAEESLKLARLRFQAGVGTQTDVIQAQTALATARGNRITAIVNYNRSLSSLRTATVLNE